MKKILLLILISFLIQACHSNSGQNKSNDKIKNTIDSIPLTVKVFKDNCVVFLMPDSLKLSKMRKEQPEDSYNEIIADIQWYIGTASESLDSLKIRNLIVHDCLLIFRQQNGIEDRIRLSNINGNMILFRNDTTPKISFAINFNQDSILKFFRK